MEENTPEIPPETPPETKDYTFDLPRLPKEKIVKFVQEYLAGAIFTSADMHPADSGQVLGMVFMPIALGALSYQEPQPKEPEEPKPPLREAYPEEPKAPKHPNELDPKFLKFWKRAEKHLADLEFKLSWDEIPEETVERQRRSMALAKEKIELKNQDKIQKYNEDMVAYAKAMETWQAERDRMDLDFKKRVLEYNEVLDQFNSGLTRRDYDLALAAWEERKNAYFQSVKENLGVIWAYMNKSFNRSINGYPMFFEVHLMHAKDWEIAKKTILREMEKAKDMKLEGEEEDQGVGTPG